MAPAGNPSILSPQELESRLAECQAGTTQSYPFLLNQSDSESAISTKKLEAWFSGIEAFGAACNISPVQWADVAIFFLAPEGEDWELKAVMSERKASHLKEMKRLFWDWDDFKDSLTIYIASPFMVYSPRNLKRRLDDWAGKTHSYPFLLNQSDSESAISANKLEAWFSGTIEACGGDCDILPLQWADVAIFFLAPEGEAQELKAVMSERKTRYLEETKRSFWDWDDFKEDFRLVNRQATEISKAAKGKENKDQLSEFYKNHPFIAASASAGLIIGGSVVLLPALGVMALNAIGFTAGGVLAGSLAATIQSILYGGLTGGLFSIFQSIGATAVLPGVTAVAGASTALGAGVSSLINLKMQRGMGEDGQDDREDGEDDPIATRPPSPVLSETL
ncbi:uncharacterized protein LACBIDRAFT_303989 [Laccaria bicolor S238N-H82]|uniref:Predicted protein n=1 Tax=Laccaria bicolor (strain S238N-H82 / ATCC MYA-4686) TaxID=486041 RepID=B0DKQ2_LACBS|nr:uncharacterized protein LACBIDRAFT_303989 [Laccaria bicolor S238N-H82]EDR04685.1 predicted protein [Laccaria bicolor S238N-H82]|eukprot:XP_001884509.1 predicted protein [Laccaria bicolor S238N-H82]